MEREVKLNLGGRESRIDGFLNIDLCPGETVDIASDISDLAMFKDGSVSEIYASHCLEHFSHKKTVVVLSEWRRVMKNGGKVYISVPSFDVLVKLFRERGMTLWIMSMLYGDQDDKFGFHYVGFTYPWLLRCLSLAGFSNGREIKDMPYGVRDRSKLVETGSYKPVSINVEAVA